MAMEDFRVDVVIGKGAGATAIPLEIPPFTLVGATTRAGLLPGPAARPVRLHRAPGVLRAPRARPDRAPLGRAARRTPRRRPAPPRSPPAPAARRGSPTGCCAGSATTPRSAPTASSPATSPVGRWSSTRSTSPGSTGSTGPCSTCSAAASAGDRSGSARSRSPSARSARPSRRWPSRSWCGPACSRARPAAGSPPPAAWRHLGLAVPAAAPFAGRRHPVRRDRTTGSGSLRQNDRERAVTLARRPRPRVVAASCFAIVCEPLTRGSS